MTDSEPDIEETIAELAEQSTASQAQIMELLDGESIREEHGEITVEDLRRHVSSVEQVNRMFDNHGEN